MYTVISNTSDEDEKRVIWAPSGARHTAVHRANNFSLNKSQRTFEMHDYWLTVGLLSSRDIVMISPARVMTTRLCESD